MTKKERDAQEKQWQFESDCRTLENHAELMTDEKRYKAAQEHLAKKAANLDRVAKLPNLTAMLFGKKTNKNK